MKDAEIHIPDIDSILKRLGAVAEEEIDASFEAFDKEALLLLSELREQQSKKNI